MCQGSLNGIKKVFKGNFENKKVELQSIKKQMKLLNCEAEQYKMEVYSPQKNIPGQPRKCRVRLVDKKNINNTYKEKKVVEMDYNLPEHETEDDSYNDFEYEDYSDEFCDNEIQDTITTKMLNKRNLMKSSNWNFAINRR